MLHIYIRYMYIVHVHKCICLYVYYPNIYKVNKRKFFALLKRKSLKQYYETTIYYWLTIIALPYSIIMLYRQNFIISCILYLSQTKTTSSYRKKIWKNIMNSLIMFIHIYIWRHQSRWEKSKPLHTILLSWKLMLYKRKALAMFIEWLGKELSNWECVQF